MNLSHNRLTELPGWISELAGLEVLLLGGNDLRGLPEECGRLASLSHLSLVFNQIESLPRSLQHLPLKELLLKGNPALQLPDSLDTPTELLRYYFETRTDRSRPLLELKLLLVGRGQAGKTTLAKRLAGEPPKLQEPETHSIAIREFSLNCPRAPVRTRAWDFGGQEVLYSTHQFFLTERSLYLLVLEPRTGLAHRDAEYWLKLIETQGARSPTIVVMNWSHGRPWRVDQVRLSRRFPFIVDFISTDALLGDGVEHLVATMASVVQSRMPDVWLPFPQRWRAIKDSLANMRDNFLTYKQFTELCRRLGEDRPDAQRDPASILHSLGLVLYFGNDPRLHDTRVLNPIWVTGGVYAVIRAQYVVDNHGQLTVTDMQRVLHEAERNYIVRASDYPPEIHGFILELMRAFQLCYANTPDAGKPTRFLVPELLPGFEPGMDEPWDSAPLRLRYRYEMMPPGLLPRFIVRTHELSEDSPHWRYGVVLRHAAAQALIREETDRPELHVFALGDDADTRRFLVAIIRRELDALHFEMKVQPVEEMELAPESQQWISVKALREIEERGNPTPRLPVQPEGTASVNVARELDKLIPAAARAIDRDPASAPVPVSLFVSFAHDDEKQLKRLDAILDVLEQQYGLACWWDKRLIAGDEWDKQIRHRLEEMDIFLFVASQTSLVRPYVRDPELKRARERHEAGEVEIVTAKLEPCAVDEDGFLGRMQRLAPRYKSIVEASPRSAAWEQVRKDLLPVIERVRVRKVASRAPETAAKTGAVLDSRSISS